MKKEKVYFVGIGGIGMSALAQLYKSQGMFVSGSDRGSSPVTDILLSKGIEVYFEHDEKNISEDVNLLVYSDAIPKENVEREKARRIGIKEMSYFEALGEVTKEGVSIVVSGTHGKTTTTAILAKMLIDAGKNPTVIAGSILSEYGSNFIAGKSDLFVIEGCEYKRHFLHLHPDILIITNIELDHTDYYKDLQDMQNAFREVVSLLPKNGVIITDTTSETILPVLEGVKTKVISYKETKVPKLLTPGDFNIENAQSAKTVVLELFDDVGHDILDKSLSDFKGTWRRFEYKGVTRNGTTIYDDYAHHPTAIKKTIEMAKETFEGKKLIVIFHPHLYSRTKDFFDEFAESLTHADTTMVLPIYAAREKNDKSVSSEKLVELINKKGGSATFVQDFNIAKNRLKKYDKDVVIITMGAGDVYKVGEELCI